MSSEINIVPFLLPLPNIPSGNSLSYTGVVDKANGDFILKAILIFVREHFV